MLTKKIHIAEPVTGEAEWQALRAPIESGWLTQGQEVSSFENEFARLHNSEFSIATTSCTTGLHLILTALGIGPGDEVILPSFTWIATANVVLYCGATPVFADIDLASFNLDAASVEEKLSSKTRAVIAVHLFGLCANMDQIQSVLPDDVYLLEDAACATGASYNGRSAGALGHAAAFSFHPRKIITTGEGGMVTTQDSAIAERMIKLRNHGAEVSEEQRHNGPKPYILPDFNILGFNYRMTDLQGAVGRVQLSRLPQLLKQRREYASIYLSELAGLNWCILPNEQNLDQCSWQSFVIRVDESQKLRNLLMDKLMARGIATRPGTHAIHLQTYYQQHFGITPDALPNSKLADQSSMAIPLHNKMTTLDLEYVVESLKALS